MNNRLKFRVWDVKNKRFSIDSSFVAILGNGRVVVSDSGYYNHFHNTNEEDYISQQYTGLKDRTGKEIYEGDILINHNPEESYMNPCVVVWSIYEDLSYAIAYKPKGLLEDCLKPVIHNINGMEFIQEYNLSLYGSYEVIGNIMENGDLLK